MITRGKFNSLINPKAIAAAFIILAAICFVFSIFEYSMAFLVAGLVCLMESAFMVWVHKKAIRENDQKS